MKYQQKIINEQKKPHRTGFVVRTEKLVPFFISLSHDADGRVVLYDGSIEGEEVEVEVVKDDKDYYKAKILRVLKPSPFRIEPECKNFGICGGCDLLYMTRDRECEEKEKIFRYYFDKFPDVQYLPSIFPERNGSRIRSVFRYDNKSKGFYHKSSHDIVNIDYCPLLDPSLNRSLADITLNKDDDKVRNQYVIASKVIDISGFKYHVSPHSFFQANLQSAAQLLRFVVESSQKCNTILDLYAGIGFFSKALESKGRKTIAIEENVSCLELANRNLKYTQYHNIKVENSQYLLRNIAFDLAVIDPPRSGMSAGAFDVIARIRPQKIVYVSCAIDKSIRDIEHFMDAGYVITKAQLFDMAPATKHIETACLLERIS